MRYKIASSVKFRNDLEVGKVYNGYQFTSRMQEDLETPLEIIELEMDREGIVCQVRNQDGEVYYVPDEMVEGLFDPSDYKWIDVFNMVSEGLLMKGTIISFKGDDYKYDGCDDYQMDFLDSNGDSVFDSHLFGELVNEYVIVIPPNAKKPKEDIVKGLREVVKTINGIIADIKEG